MPPNVPPSPIDPEAAPPLEVRPAETVSMHTRDGARLAADVYRPEEPGPWPVLLMRVAGGRRLAQTGLYAHPRWYAGHGYMVVVQDVRGTGASEGRFRPFVHEAADGADAVAWAASLPGADGRVGMLGSGYAGYAQRLAAGMAPDALAAIAPAFAGSDAHGDWAYRNGALRLADGMRFALETGAAAARRVEDGTAHRALADAAERLPLDDEIPARPRVLRDYARYTHWDDWLGAPEPGAFWDALRPAAVPKDVAVLTIAGWRHARLEGDVAAHRSLASDTGRTAPATLIIGPWDEAGWKTTIADMDRLHLSFFSGAFARGDDPAAFPPLLLNDQVTEGWCSLDRWPDTRAWTLFPTSDRRAATRAGAGRLVDVPLSESRDAITLNPSRPVPEGTVIGRAVVDARPDVAVYDGTDLTRPVRLTGSVQAELFVEADTPAFDVCATLAVVMPEGPIAPLADDYARIEAGHSAGPLLLSFGPVCATLPVGSRVRLSVAASRFPAFAVNSGTGAEPAETRRVDGVPITLTLRTGGARPSRLILPEVG